MQSTDEITVTLNAAEWNQVLALLGEGPFRVVAPLITKIHDQALRANGGSTAGTTLTEGPLVQN
jgi:hypothetical protein